MEKILDMGKVSVSEVADGAIETANLEDAALLYDIQRSLESIAKKKKEKYKEQIYGYLTKQGTKEDEVTKVGNFEVYYSTPEPSEKIDKAMLLAAGVALEIIQQCTVVGKESPRLYVKQIGKKDETGS